MCCESYKECHLPYFYILIQDHQKLEKQIFKARDCIKKSDNNGMINFLNYVKTNIFITHHKREHCIFNYALMCNKPKYGPIVDRLLSDHEVEYGLVDKLLASRTFDRTWVREFEEVLDNIGEHMEFENKFFFELEKCIPITCKCIIKVYMNNC